VRREDVMPMLVHMKLGSTIPVEQSAKKLHTFIKVLVTGLQWHNIDPKMQAD
jgi:hypothetical protein